LGSNPVESQFQELSLLPDIEPSNFT
jgi:hypothetical protein